MMFVDISLKMLTLGPLIRSIICHHSLLLMGKPSMTGIILTFPGMQPTGNKTKTSACPSTHIHDRKGTCSHSSLK